MGKSRVRSSLHPRHSARLAAFRIIFEIDQGGQPPERVLQARLLEDLESGDLRPDQSDFVVRLVRGVAQHIEQIDRLIELYAPSRPLEEIAATERAILRLAIFELCFDNESPLPVVIDEAVELVKVFGGEHSGRFVNGVLGTIAVGLGSSRIGESTDE